MPSCYLKDRKDCMLKDGPPNHQFKVHGGTLLYNPERDARLPYIYLLMTHRLVHDKRITKILVHVVNPSINDRIECAKFHKTLEVPLGPNALMVQYGKSNYYYFAFLLFQ